MDFVSRASLSLSKAKLLTELIAQQHHTLHPLKYHGTVVLDSLDRWTEYISNNICNNLLCAQAAKHRTGNCDEIASAGGSKMLFNFIVSSSFY